MCIFVCVCVFILDRLRSVCHWKIIIFEEFKSMNHEKWLNNVLCCEKRLNNLQPKKKRMKGTGTTLFALHAKMWGIFFFRSRHCNHQFHSSTHFKLLFIKFDMLQVIFLYFWYSAHVDRLKNQNIIFVVDFCFWHSLFKQWHTAQAEKNGLALCHLTGFHCR